MSSLSALRKRKSRFGRQVHAMGHVTRGRTVLLTGGRSAVALQFARMLWRAGHEVLVAESVGWQLCRVSRAVRRSFLVPSVRFNPDGYVEALARIIEMHDVSLVIPTCEETYTIAMNRSLLGPGCELLAPDARTLLRLHSKWQFVEEARCLGLAVPASRCVTTPAEARDAISQFGDAVLKPEFSRFGTETVIRPDSAIKLERLGITPARRWVVQEHVDGRHLCTYSLCRKGRIVAHVAYPARFRAAGGVPLHMAAMEHDASRQWIGVLAAELALTGQIALDFIERPSGEALAIECNPRATSGLHLFARETGFVDCLFGASAGEVVPRKPQPVQYKAGMLFGLMRHVRSGREFLDWLSAFQSARGAVDSWRDPLPGLWRVASLLGAQRLARKQGISLPAAMTHDMDWNGEGGLPVGSQG